MENLPKKVRSKKLSTRVDLTAMVSISFLLIIFFMVTIELAKPKGFDLGLPDKERGGCGGCVRGNRLYTILLDENDKMVTYSGILEFDLDTAKKIEFEKNEIRKEIFLKKKEVTEYMASVGKPKSGVIIIIKPSQKCNFKNLVDILDEMKIAKIDNYAIVDEYTLEESKLLASK